VVAMRRLNLKEDDEGNKTTTIQGIRASVKIMKTRFTKPFETMHVKIPYHSGIDPFSGLVDYFEEKGVLAKDGNKLKYIGNDKKEHKMFRKEWETLEGREILMGAMRDYEKAQDAEKEKILREAEEAAKAMEALNSLITTDE
jgi:hypothetical protein